MVAYKLPKRIHPNTLIFFGCRCKYRSICKLNIYIPLNDFHPFCVFVILEEALVTMAGASVGRSLPRPCSGRKTLRRCRNNAATDNVVFIDVDGDDVENAIDIDSPELFSKKLRGSSVRKDKQRQQRVIICIDDEESTDNKHPDTGGKKRCNFSSDASSSKGPSAAADNHDKFQNEASDDVEFVQENVSSPVKISKCKRTYSGKASSRNRYGLGPESEDDFSNDEVEEDSSGSVREQWEKAFSKRKYESRTGQTGGVGCSKTSKASHHANFSGEKVVSRQPKEPPVVSSAEEMSCETEGSPSSTVAGNIHQDSNFTSKRPSSADPLSKSTLNEHGPYNEGNFDYGPDCRAENASMDGGEKYDPDLKYDGCNLPNAEPEEPFFNPQHSAKEVDPATESSQVRDNSETTKEESSGSPVEHREQASCNSKSENSNDQSGNRDYSVYPDDMNNDAEGSAAEQLKNSSTFSIPGKENYKRNFLSPLFSIGNLPREPFSKRGNFGGRILKSVLKGRCPYNKTSTHSTIDPLVEESKMNCAESQDTQLSNHDFQVCADKVGSLHSKIFSRSTCDITPAPNVDGYPVHETSSSSCVNEVVILHEKSGSVVGSAANCMISEREKLKDTDEYKKAMEEEWASRRQVLQAQAEEAQQLRRLRKRENAERMRILDMERRQKKRVEEIRETNKKDEEQMNMKDLIRAEVRNELSKVEISCCDMASVLRSLGIQVGSELRPNADEVRVACKRALFAFHPDRASKSDTRQQVEAEEKFKLISRMKEKFSVA